MHLFIGSHPDDLEISCMGYIVKLLKEKQKIYLYICSDGDKIRYDEQIASFKELKKIGDFKFQIDKFKIRTFEENFTAIRNRLEEIIRINNIHYVYAPYVMDTHIDHRTLAQAAIDASRKISLIFYESPSSYDLEPNYFAILNKEILDIKVKLFKIHRSQYTKSNSNYFYNKIISTADFRGISIYEKYAEAYKIAKLKK
ncbi:MAG: PIG-L family deacetylase [Candidatus Lokiarchaeota archaeon]|nr:PIG-L family deacetylase [Candidatus Lokiarchaeota archaeon]